LFRSKFLGRTLSAVTIEPGPGRTTAAVTDNFLKAGLEEEIPANRLVTARMEALTADGLRGTVGRGEGVVDDHWTEATVSGLGSLASAL
jgi:hypothetical protein